MPPSDSIIKLTRLFCDWKTSRWPNENPFCTAANRVVRFPIIILKIIVLQFCLHFVVNIILTGFSMIKVNVQIFPVFTCIPSIGMMADYPKTTHFVINLKLVKIKMYKFFKSRKFEKVDFSFLSR